MSYLNSSQAFCAYCKEPCEIAWEDVGVGYYEYWGRRGRDVKWIAISNCCSAGLLQTPESDEAFDMTNWEPDFQEEN